LRQKSDGSDRISTHCGNQGGWDGAGSLGAPPLGMGVGRDSGGAADMSRIPVAAPDGPMIEAGLEIKVFLPLTFNKHNIIVVLRI